QPILDYAVIWPFRTKGHQPVDFGPLKSCIGGYSKAVWHRGYPTQGGLGLFGKPEDCYRSGFRYPLGHTDWSLSILGCPPPAGPVQPLFSLLVLSALSQFALEHSY